MFKVLPLPFTACRRAFSTRRTKTARKRLAVPFRAAHTPSERSELAHPDAALLATTIAYYQDGLSRAELRSALQVLLRLGGSAQAAHYGDWLALSMPGIPQNEYCLLDSAAKIDTTNEEQVRVWSCKEQRGGLRSGGAV